MTARLPLDNNGHPIPAMRYKQGGAHSVIFGAVSARNAVAFPENTRIVSLYATADVYIRFGGGDVTAASSDHFFPGGVYYDVALGGGDGTAHYTHVAALRHSGDGVLYISEKE